MVHVLLTRPTTLNKALSSFPLGLHCEENVNECLSTPCQNNGLCQDQVNGYTCQCAPGFEGIHCGVDINECARGQCQNGADCVDGVNSYRCICTAGWTGQDCNVDLLECLSQPCANGGSCVERTNAYICDCAPGYVCVCVYISWFEVTYSHIATGTVLAKVLQQNQRLPN